MRHPLCDKLFFMQHQTNLSCAIYRVNNANNQRGTLQFAFIMPSFSKYYMISDKNRSQKSCIN